MFWDYFLICERDVTIPRTKVARGKEHLKIRALPQLVSEGQSDKERLGPGLSQKRNRR